MREDGIQEVVLWPFRLAQHSDDCQPLEEGGDFQDSWSTTRSAREQIATRAHSCGLTSTINLLASQCMSLSLLRVCVAMGF